VSDLTVDQVADELQVNVAFVRALIRTGELVAYTLGATPRSGYRITPEALADYKHRHQVTPDLTLEEDEEETS
jgi:excisionase family DNA binding protein